MRGGGRGEVGMGRIVGFFFGFDGDGGRHGGGGPDGVVFDGGGRRRGGGGGHGGGEDVVIDVHRVGLGGAGWVPGLAQSGDARGCTRRLLIQPATPPHHHHGGISHFPWFHLPLFHFP